MFKLTKLNKLDQLLKQADKLLLQAEQDPDEQIRESLSIQAMMVVRNAKKAIQEEINKAISN